jgi:putative flippase GtrA
MIKGLLRHPRSTISFYLNKYRLLNFMIVGGIGYIINMALYYPLTLVFSKEVTFLGSHFYLPPFLVSTYIAATCQYFMNKAWTFGDMQKYSQSYLRYLSAVAVTVIGDIALLAVIVDFGHLRPELAAALAILVMFLFRYSIVKRWVWQDSRDNKEKEAGKERDITSKERL